MLLYIPPLGVIVNYVTTDYTCLIPFGGGHLSYQIIDKYSLCFNVRLVPGGRSMHFL